MSAKRDDDRLNFSRVPPDGAEAPNWRVLRVPDRRHVVGVAISGQVVGHLLHYDGRRSIPCLRHDSDCDLCGSQQPRWYGYVALYQPKTHGRVLLEITPSAAWAFERYFCEHRSIRGALVECWRQPQRANGKIWATVVDARLDDAALPQPPSVAKMLRRMWALPDTVRLDWRDDTQLNPPGTSQEDVA
jgi:hypothetical protein